MKYVKKVLGFMLTLLILETAFAIHEYGHLVEYQKKGVSVEEFSFGIGWLVYQHQGEDFKISVRAIPVMAYVAPTSEGATFAEELPLSDKLLIYSAGVRNNLLVGLLGVFTLQVLGWRRGNLSSKELTRTMLLTPVRIVARYFILIVEGLTFSLVRLRKLRERFHISTGEIIPQKRVRQLIIFNLVLGILNFVPVLPLDGGKFASAALPQLSTVAAINPWVVFVAARIFLWVCIVAAGREYQDLLESDLRTARY